MGTPGNLANSGQRLAGLDLLRAAMMLLGIVVHAGIPYAVGGMSPGYWVAPERSMAVTVVLLVIHHWRMPVFFFLAGFHGRHLLQRDGATGFLRQRARRILVPWLVALALLTPVMAWVARWNGSQALHEAPLHLWFLEYLLLFSVALVVAWQGDRLRLLDRIGAFVWSGRGWSRWLGLVGPTMATLGLFPYGVVPYPAEFTPWWQVALTHGWFYAAGAMFYAARPHVRWRPLGTLAIALLPLNLWLTERAVAGVMVPGYWLIVSAACLIWATLAALVGAAMNYSSGLSPRLREVAEASYWIYLVHFPLALALPKAVSAVVPGVWLPLLLVVAASFVVSLKTRPRRLI